MIYKKIKEALRYAWIMCSLNSKEYKLVRKLEKETGRLLLSKKGGSEKD